jgi:fumarate reductase subunit D
MDNADGIGLLAARAQRAKLASWTMMVLTALLLVFEVAETLGMFDPAMASDLAVLLYLCLAVVYLVAFCVSVVLVSMWIHRAHANLHDAGYAGLDFTPGWAVGWYFIPIANLFKPYQAMRELWNASISRGEFVTGPAPGAIVAWWTTWIVSNIIGNLSTRFSFSENLDLYTLAAPLGAISSALFMPCAWLLIGIIRDITAAQRDGMAAVETE